MKGCSCSLFRFSRRCRNHAAAPVRGSEAASDSECGLFQNSDSAHRGLSWSPDDRGLAKRFNKSLTIRVPAGPRSNLWVGSEALMRFEHTYNADRSSTNPPSLAGQNRRKHLSRRRIDIIELYLKVLLMASSRWIVPDGTGFPLISRSVSSNGCCDRVRCYV
jgi:hypothetical protein